MFKYALTSNQKLQKVNFHSYFLMFLLANAFFYPMRKVRVFSLNMLRMNVPLGFLKKNVHKCVDVEQKVTKIELPFVFLMFLLIKWALPPDVKSLTSSMR